MLINENYQYLRLHRRTKWILVIKVIARFLIKYSLLIKDNFKLLRLYWVSRFRRLYRILCWHFVQKPLPRKKYIPVANSRISKIHFEELYDSYQNSCMLWSELPLRIFSNISICLKKMGKFQKMQILYSYKCQYWALSHFKEILI